MIQLTQYSMLTPEQEQVISKEALDKFPPVDGYDFEQQCSRLGYTTAATAYQEKINQQAEEIERLKSLVIVAFRRGYHSHTEGHGSLEALAIFKQQHNL